MEITIYEGEDGTPKVTVREDTPIQAEMVAIIYKAVKKELLKEEE